MIAIVARKKVCLNYLLTLLYVLLEKNNQVIFGGKRGTDLLKQIVLECIKRKKIITTYNILLKYLLWA
jgi:DNA-binding protein